VSRVSLNRRLQALLEAAEAHDPHAVRLHRLTPEARLQYDQWRRACDAEYARFDGDEPGAAYEALLEGSLHLPEPPRAVAEALGLPEPIVLTDAMTTEDLARLWSEMIEG
jgi:hypothetical protein